MEFGSICNTDGGIFNLPALLYHVISIGFPPLQFPPLVGGGSLTRGGTWGAKVFLNVFIDLGAGGAHPQFPPLWVEIF